MNQQIQDGIYFQRGSKIGKSCYIVFVKTARNSTGSEIGNVLVNLWKMLKNLQNGKVESLDGVNERHFYRGNLTFLIGYGHEIFSVANLRRKKPTFLSNLCPFSSPNLSGGGPILPNSSITYSKDVRDNHASSEHIVLQFIGDDEFVTSRAVIEAWKLLSGFEDFEGKEILYITRIYSGFQRQDNRSWLGFHDGVSNSRSDLRSQIIAVGRNDVEIDETWTINGTYMGFLRTEIDIKGWNSMDPIEQSKVIGRDKISGCPIIGIDKKGMPVKDNRCPIGGTFEVVEKGNEIFREHPLFAKQKYTQLGISKGNLENSHIAKANPKDKSLIGHSGQYRIFRQGFEFLEPLEFYPGFRIGLNFISFQNDPKKLMHILEHGFSRNNTKNTTPDISLEQFFSVRTAGIFFVPPYKKEEPFPGASIFSDKYTDQSMIRQKYFSQT